MSLQPKPIPEVPEETARIAQASFPKGNTYMRMRDELGPIFDDEQFTELFSKRGQPAASPAQLALVTVMQFAEGLSDRAAASSVRGRIDWKYALGLDITDPGFDASVLSEFRTRLVEGNAELLLFETMLTRLREKGLLKARGRMRTDSTHILAAIRTLGRLECIGETLRQGLNVVATVVPEWLKSWVPAEWYDRYGRRFEEYRLPKSRQERYILGEQIGRDGYELWERLGETSALRVLRDLPAMETLRQVWVQQFVWEQGELRWRESGNLPPAARMIQSPYDIEARYAKKRETEWTGYKVHLTESCDEASPHLIVNVETTKGPIADYDMTPQIHDHLASRQLSPSEHLLDNGYASADHLVTSRQQGIDLITPVSEERSWQARMGKGFDSGSFLIDWKRNVATCPQGQTSQHGYAVTVRGRPMHTFKFPRSACGNCASRPECTKSVHGFRKLTVQPQPAFEALQAARQRQKEEDFRAQYARRAGVEGTVSQAVAIADLRRARYVGLAKTRLQHILTALGMNVLRLGAWWSDRKRSKTYTAPFARLATA